jgi:hypothetical protein
MPGFGKRNARGVDLRTVMIYAAAEVFEKEKEARRLLRKDEMQEIVQLVCSSQNVETSRFEFSSAVAGTKRLAMNRAFIESIATRWSRGNIALQNDDIKRAGEILEDTSSETARVRPIM